MRKYNNLFAWLLATTASWTSFAYANTTVNPPITFGPEFTVAPGGVIHTTQQQVYTVANLTALKAITGGTVTTIYREGFSTFNDGGQANYGWQAGACTLNGGNGDNGLEVKPNAGTGCYIASIAATGADVRLWGNVGTTNDTAILQAADLAVVAASWPAGASKTIWLPAGNVAFYNPHVVNIKYLYGVGDFGGTNIVPATGATTSGALLDYVGSGPFTFGNMAFVCTTYYANAGVFAEPTNCGDRMFYAGSASSGVQTNQISKLTGRNLVFTGGNASARIQNTQEIDLQVDEINVPYDHGIIVSAQLNGSGVLTARGNVDINRCTGTGQYCVSTPVGVSSTPVSFAPRNLTIKINDCVGAGFISQKGCADFVTEVGEQLSFDVRGSNSYFGVETKVLKLSPFATGNTTPNAYQAQHGIVTMYQNIDAQPCLQVVSENPVPLVSSFFRTNHTFDVTCHYNPPIPWVANNNVSAGQVFYANSNTYIVVAAGQTGSSSPASTAVNTRIDDGTAILQYVQPLALTPVALIGVILEAMSYVDITLHAHQIAIGYLVFPRGSSDNTLRFATLKFSGEVQKYCLVDSSDALFGTGVTADHVTLDNWNCSAFGTDSPISLGNSVAAHTMQWSNLQINGGSYIATNSTVAGALRINNGASSSLISGTITGAKLLGGTSAINSFAPTSLNIFGGSLENTAGSGATAGLITSSDAAANGVINLFGVGAINSDPAQGTFTVGAGSLEVKGNAINPPSAGAPATACSTSIDTVYSTVAGEYYACVAGVWTKKF